MSWFKRKGSSAPVGPALLPLEPGRLRCFACDREMTDDRRLIAGRGVSICDDCLQVAAAIHRDSSAARITRLRPTADGRRCSFCAAESPLVSSGTGGICLACVTTCTDRLDREDVAPPVPAPA
ncbi:MAG: ClpX C4-type zinc finger protein, partial [Thermoanaerobaculia bacterium]|nr:ClpX C4-type zinc finger protein [Thermoanaerobaculia bacterium]